LKLKHWCGSPGIFGRNGAPNGGLRFFGDVQRHLGVCIATSANLFAWPKLRHSSDGWNPVRRISKILDGLGPSFRWDDGLRALPGSCVPQIIWQQK